MDKKKKNLLFGITIYFVSAIASFLLFTSVLGGTSLITPIPEPTRDGDKTVFDDSLPKTEECPLNGALWSKQQRAWWEEHRPLGVMIENHEEARPQSGLSYADVVYEVVAEGGLTRFLAIYHCRDAGIVGPIRSARTYYLDFISEYGDYPLYAHVGGANTPGPADALGQINQYGWSVYNDLNQFSIGFPTFWRDYERLGPVATEHTVYSTTEKLWEVAESRDLTNVDEDGNSWDEDFRPYIFKEDKPSGKSQVINFNFWEGFGGAYSIEWNYDPTTNSYLRKNGGVPHKDMNTDEQLFSKTLVMLYMRESRANDGYPGNVHLLYGTTGSGNATVFMDGQEIDATWAKRSRTARLILTDSSGQEIEFNRGQIWFSVLPTVTSIVVK